jgi:hypothetical protein
VLHLTVTCSPHCALQRLGHTELAQASHKSDEDYSLAVNPRIKGVDPKPPALRILSTVAEHFKREATHFPQKETTFFTALTASTSAIAHLRDSLMTPLTTMIAMSDREKKRAREQKSRLRRAVCHNQKPRDGVGKRCIYYCFDMLLGKPGSNAAHAGRAPVGSACCPHAWG